MATSFDRESVTHAAKDALYVSVGLGLLAFQKMQVRRREINKMLVDHYGVPLGAIDRGLEALEVKLDRVMDEVESLLPAVVGKVVAAAHDSARGVRRQVRTALLTPA